MSDAASKLPAGKPCVLYLRRSTDRQEQSIGDQRTHLTRYAAENGFEILDEFVDDGISGTSADARGAFQRMIAEAQGRCRFRFILCYDVKRFSRGDLDEVGYYRHLLRQRNVEVVYATEPFTDDFTSELIRPMRQWQARQESVDLSRLTVRGQVSAVQAGSYFGSTPPWGFDYEYRNSGGEPYQIVRYLRSGEKEVYDPGGVLKVRVPFGERPPRMDHDTVRLVLSLPERVETIRQIFHWYIHDGHGTRAITTRLNQQGIASPRCGQWGRTHYTGAWGNSTVANILKNQAYAGDTVWNKRTEGKFHKLSDGRSVQRPRSMAGLSELNPKEDWVVVRDTHPAIVSRATFEAAQRILAGRDHTRGFRHKLLGRGRTSNFLLAGLITCEACGHRFSGWSQKIKRKVRPAPEDRRQVYLCGGYLHKGKSVCRRAAIEKRPFEDFIVEQVRVRLMSILEGGAMTLLKTYVREELAEALANPRAELARVEADLAQLKADADRLLASITPVNAEFVDEKLVELKRTRRELQDRQLALEQAAARDLNLEAASEAALGHLARFRDVLDQGTFFEQKEFLGKFIEGITLHPFEQRGVLKMRDMVAASLDTTGWSRPKLYRRLSHYRIPRSFGRP